MNKSHRMRSKPFAEAPEPPSSLILTKHPVRTPSTMQGQKDANNNRRKNSRHGCKECKSRRVKCDETFPVCLRCQAQGSVCLPAVPPPMQLQAALSWTLTKTPKEPWAGIVKPDKKLLQYWLENTSRMMAITPETNPLSFPLVEHLLYTPSLVHAVQSISAGQEGCFSRFALQKCLRERGLAMGALQRELQDVDHIKPASLLTVLLLGVSSSWAENRPLYYGQEHMSGARALLGKALADTRMRVDPVVHYILGWYLYWDMTCAFIAEPDSGIVDLSALDVCIALEPSRASFHPMIGFSARLFFYLACLGRYCRRALETGVNDPDIEAAFEKQLLEWDPRHEDKTLVEMSLAYRDHGLLMLYDTCGRPRQPQSGQQTGNAGECAHDAMHLLALETLERLLGTPINAACINFQSLPLLTAGAQLRPADIMVRFKVVKRFQALYSTNRIVVNLWAVELLEELWCLRDSGVAVSWLELLLSKNWTLNFA